MANSGQRTGYLPGGARYENPGRSGWTGWILFAGIMMVMIGSFHAIIGLVALFQDDYFLTRSSGLVISVDYTVWGWTHILLGLLVAGAGFGVALGQFWARTVGVILAMLSLVDNMLFIAAYPIWSLIVITFDVLVIYALIVHGSEMKDV